MLRQDFGVPWRTSFAAVSSGLRHSDAVDKLVMSLLSPDPTARPASAAHVIDQLSAIAGLEGEEGAGAAQSYFLNSRLVGRTSELERLRGRLFRAAQGLGGSAIGIEAMGGMGRTRLSSELLLEAELLGVGVLMVQAGASSQAYGVVRALLASARERIPKMRAILERRRSLLSHIAPELDALGEAPTTTSTDPIELRTLLGSTQASFDARCDQKAGRGLE